MAIECTSIAIINMPRLIKGSTYTGITPVSPTINRGMIQAAANRIQTETKGFFRRKIIDAAINTKYAIIDQNRLKKLSGQLFSMKILMSG
ncbi:MAG: hypothetical protein ACYS0C_07090 [Planctomycetota bacterium]